MNKTKKNATIADVIKARRIALNTREGYASLVLRIVVLVLAVYVIFTEVFLITQNNGLGMFPAMKDGDLVIAFRLQEEYAKNDMVIFENEGRQEVGRIVAKENDSVAIDEEGTLRINGTVQTGEILYPTYAKESLEYPYLVPEGHVFIMGDYRTNTVDSRDYGPIPMGNLKAKVITILRRRGL